MRVNENNYMGLVFKAIEMDVTENPNDMKICFVSDIFPPRSIGGIERYLDDLTRKLNEKDIETYVITGTYNSKSTERKGNLTVYRRSFMDRSLKEDQRRKGRKLFKFLENLIEKKGINLIEAENLYKRYSLGFGLALNMLSFNTDIPFILRMHSGCSNSLDKSLLKHLLWTKVIGVSRYISEHAYEVGLPIGKLLTVYPGVDTYVFRPNLGREWLRSRIDVNNDDILVLCATRLVTASRPLLEEKGITTLLKAFSTVSQRYKNLKLLIAAALPPSKFKKYFNDTVKKIYDLAKLNKIDDKVIIKSFGLEEMPFVYNGSDIFVLASRRESFGLSYAEAMSCCLPVIGTSVGAVPEIIRNTKNGYLVEPDKPVELARKIEILIEKPKRRKTFGKRGRLIVLQKFNLDMIVEKLLKIFNSCIKKKI